MMDVVLVYMIFVMLVITTAPGSLQSCLDYCNFSSEFSSIPPECNCSLNTPKPTSSSTKSKHHNARTKESKIYYEPADINSTQKAFLWEGTLNDPKYKEYVSNVNTIEAPRDNDDENHSNSRNRNKKTDSFFLKDVTEFPLYLYLDMDMYIKNNESLLEDLKDMFTNFQATEKDLSKCINLHVYIFSKRIGSINKTDPKWGPNAGHNNNLAHDLTEIQSTCQYPASIIKKSLFQIKQVSLRKELNTEIVQHEQETTMHSVEWSPLSEYVTNVENESSQSNANKFQHDDLPLFNANVTDDMIKNNEYILTSDSPLYDASTVVFGDESLKTTSEADRIILNEEDILTPRIITKELSNGTITSVVDGYENYSDFIYDTSTTFNTPNIILNSNDSKNKYETYSHVDNIDQSDLINIHGGLYFFYGKKYIPARFIQQSDGELNIAIDGFSMCDQILSHNTSNFMNLLCKCIKQ